MYGVQTGGEEVENMPFLCKYDTDEPLKNCSR